MNIKEKTYWVIGMFSQKFRFWYYKKYPQHTLWGFMTTINDYAIINPYIPTEEDIIAFKEIISHIKPTNKND